MVNIHKYIRLFLLCIVASYINANPPKTAPAYSPCISSAIIGFGFGYGFGGVKSAAITGSFAWLACQATKKYISQFTDTHQAENSFSIIESACETLKKIRKTTW